MKQIRYVFIVVSMAVTISCKSNDNNINNGDTPLLPPVENQELNTNYKPAFEGQTRIGGVKTTTPYHVEILSQELSRPWSIVAMPDGRLLITEKGGTMRISSADGTLSSKITGIPAVNAGGQGGLQGLALAPDFASSRLIYFVFSERTPQGNVAAIAKGTLAVNETIIENTQVIYRALPAWNSENHYGGCIVFDKEGNMFLSVGERSVADARPKAQLLDNALGKIVHITPGGTPVGGGPFADMPGAFPEIYSYGHRNPLGMDFHPETGDLWAVEMGPRGGDELNLIKPGNNYGWPTITYGIEYSGAPVGDGITQQEGMVQPVYYWDPVISPGGITFYDSDVIEEWKNNIFIAGLSSKHIARIVIKDNKVVGEERLLEGEGQRFRDVVEYMGVIYAITDEGRLYRISKRK